MEKLNDIKEIEGLLTKLSEANSKTAFGTSYRTHMVNLLLNVSNDIIVYDDRFKIYNPFYKNSMWVQKKIYKNFQNEVPTIDLLNNLWRYMLIYNLHNRKMWFDLFNKYMKEIFGHTIDNKVATTKLSEQTKFHFDIINYLKNNYIHREHEFNKLMNKLQLRNNKIGRTDKIVDWKYSSCKESLWKSNKLIDVTNLKEQL